MKEKPPVLSDEEVTKIIFTCKGNCTDARRAVNVAQRDADVEWYEGLFREMVRDLFNDLYDTYWQSLKSKYLI